MKKEQVSKSEIKLVGLKARTNNQNEMNPETAKIGALFGKYLSQNMSGKIPNRTNPGVTLCAYTEYDTDEHGDYTYFIGEEVSTFDNIPEELQTIILPASNYQRFTTEEGKMPEIVIHSWQKIWKMTEKDFGGKRSYQGDFELYDQRAMDPANTSLDIYIAIK